jgi:hypothetical protein
MDSVMRSLGYVLASVTERHATYEPRAKTNAGAIGEHVDDPLTIEVHTVIAESLPVRRVDITERLTPAELSPGVNAYPTLAAAWLHLLLHAAVHMTAHTLRYLQLRDLTLLAGRLREADWRALLDLAHDGEALWWAYPPLALTLRYHDCTVPTELTRALRRGCPLLLRGLSDRQDLTKVSYSNLRIDALPGLAWARTPAEAFRYARSRALPSKDKRAKMREALDLVPHLRRIPWYEQSQTQRIARWLTSRPPRPQTLMSVMAALRQPEAGGEPWR